VVGSGRDIVQEFKDDDLESGRETTAERKHQDEEVEDGGYHPGGGDGVGR